MRIVLLCLSGMSVFPLAAQQPTHACANVAVPAERLACYDRAFPLPAPVAEAASRQAIADFGLSRSRNPLRNPGQTAEQSDPGSVQGKVVQVDQLGDGQRSITLEGGQRWTTLEASSTGHMQVGETVTLRRGVMGNYLLITRAGATLRVRRVR